MAGKRKKKSIWATEEERAAHEARVDQTLRRLRALADKAWAELEKKNPALKDL